MSGKQYKRLKLQLNKNAQDSTLKKLAQQNSHEVWGETVVELEVKVELKAGGKVTKEKTGKEDTEAEADTIWVRSNFQPFLDEELERQQRSPLSTTTTSKSSYIMLSCCAARKHTQPLEITSSSPSPRWRIVYARDTGGGFGGS